MGSGKRQEAGGLPGHYDVSTRKLGSHHWLLPLIQEGVEEREEQQRQLGQQRHPVVEVVRVCGAGVVGAQSLSCAIDPCQSPLEVLPDWRQCSVRNTVPFHTWAKIFGPVFVLSSAPGTQPEQDGYALYIKWLNSGTEPGALLHVWVISPLQCPGSTPTPAADLCPFILWEFIEHLLYARPQLRC